MGCGDLTSAVAMLPQPLEDSVPPHSHECTESGVPTFSGSTILIGYMTTNGRGRLTNATDRRLSDPARMPE